MKCNYSRIISCYSADTAGVCSALFELGGMTIVHDASGCNSTYATHDEPRWFDSESMVYISALSEMDMVCGNDRKLVDDVVRSASDLKPLFIALCNSPIPLMVGCDMTAVAWEIERVVNIPCFAVRTSGMEHYWLGASRAWLQLAERFLPPVKEFTVPRSVNILGATPLDFSTNGNVESIAEFLEKRDFTLLATWAMNNTLADLQKSVNAELNLVISQSGLPLAEYMFEKYGIPFICGVPVGIKGAEALADALNSKKITYCCSERTAPDKASCVIIGDAVFSGSLAQSLSAETGISCRVIDPLSGAKKLLNDTDVQLSCEKDIAGEFAAAELIVCDNMYLPVVPAGRQYIALPHEAFSGRCYHKKRLNLIDKKINWEDHICRK